MTLCYDAPYTCCPNIQREFYSNANQVEFIRRLICPKGTSYVFWKWAEWKLNQVDCPSRNQAGIIATGEIRQNVKFAAFWCVFLTKIKVDPESW